MPHFFSRQARSAKIELFILKWQKLTCNVRITIKLSLRKVINERFTCLCFWSSQSSLNCQSYRGTFPFRMVRPNSASSRRRRRCCQRNLQRKRLRNLRKHRSCSRGIPCETCASWAELEWKQIETNRCKYTSSAGAKGAKSPATPPHLPPKSARTTTDTPQSPDVPAKNASYTARTEGLDFVALSGAIGASFVQDLSPGSETPHSSDSSPCLQSSGSLHSSRSPSPHHHHCSQHCT